MNAEKEERTKLRGALVVFEGCDHSGKTTQCQKLVATLNQQGIPTKSMRFPGKMCPGYYILGYTHNTGLPPFRWSK